MAKVYKVTFYVVDANEQYRDGEWLEVDVENAIDASVVHYNAVESKSFEWDDNLPINYTCCPASEYDKYFE